MAPPTLFLLEANMFAPEGGKTGITAIVTGLMFLVSVFFAPIFASIPSWATGGALVIVGSLMIRKWVVAYSPPLSIENTSTVRSLTFHFVFTSASVRDINWDYIGDSVPAFLTIIITPLSFKLSSVSFRSVDPQRLMEIGFYPSLPSLRVICICPT
jgi:AGZA family xanthine/uracil permease-like MFS transporter